MLIVIDWSKRELAKTQQKEMGTLSAAFTNVFDALCNVGVFEGPDRRPNRLGKMFTELFGQTHPQKTKAAMRRSFKSFLEVLEEAIQQELQHSTQLFGMFESVERTFVNLARTVKREEDTQDIEEAQYLAALWVKLMGPEAAELKKYKRNRDLLVHLKAKAKMHKHMVKEQQAILLRMSQDMETLRRMLAAPLVRSESQFINIEEQINGLVEAHSYLRGAREKARATGLQMLWGSGRGRPSITREDREIESGNSNYLPPY